MLIYYFFVGIATLMDPIMAPIALILNVGLVMNRLPFLHIIEHMAQKECEKTMK